MFVYTILFSVLIYFSRAWTGHTGHAREK